MRGYKIGVVNADVNTLKCQIVGGEGTNSDFSKISKCSHVIRTPSFCDILNFFSSPVPLV